MNKIKKKTFLLLIFIFGFFFCNSIFSQEQTVVKVKNIDYENMDIVLNGKVKSVMIITHGGNYSCDTIKPYFDYTIFEGFIPGVCWVVQCKVDTLIYNFDSNLVISQIIKNNFLVIKENVGKIERTEYNFTNGLIQSQKTTINGKKDHLILYRYDSHCNLIKKTRFYRNYKSIEYSQYDERDNLIEKKEYLQHKNDLYWPRLRSQEKYKYDSSSHLIEKKWAGHRVDIFKYDTLGNKIEEGYYSKFTEKSSIYYPSKGFEYDSNNNLIKSFYLRDVMPYKTDCYYIYDNQQRIIENKGLKIGNDTVVDYHYIFAYNENGKLIKKEALIGRGFWENNYEKSFNMIIYQYNEYGNIIKQENYCSESNKDPNIIQFIYTYDSHGNWIKKETWMGKTKDKLERTKIEDRIIEYY